MLTCFHIHLLCLQWYSQDGCWQSDKSWQTGGSLGLLNHMTNSNDIFTHAHTFSHPRLCLQWYPQDGCWQSDKSWQMGGSLGLLNHVTNNDVLGLQPVEQYASLMYTVVTQVRACGDVLTFLGGLCVFALKACAHLHSG